MSYQQLSDIELIKEFNSGKQAAIEHLINRHKRKVFSYILINIKKREIAEDIFQDTFIKVIKSLRAGKYNDEGKFISWVMRIAHNLLIDHFRKEKHMPTISDGDYDYDIFNNSRFSEKTREQEIIKDQIQGDVRKLIELLPDDQREVVVLRHFSGMSFREIAEQTNVSINTALGRMRYAILNLRRLIDEKNLILTDY